MEHTVVGFFDDATEAQQAVSELVKFGIPRNQIDVSNGQLNSEDSGVSAEANGEKKSGIAKFFNYLFGDDSDDAKKYSSVGESANTMVTVHVATGEEAEEAADILDDLGAFNIDERASQQGFFSNPSLDAKTGGGRGRSRIVERPVADNIRLREENVRADRQTVDRPITGNEMGTDRRSDTTDLDGRLNSGI